MNLRTFSKIYLVYSLYFLHLTEGTIPGPQSFCSSTPSPFLFEGTGEDEFHAATSIVENGGLSFFMAGATNSP